MAEFNFIHNIPESLVREEEMQLTKDALEKNPYFVDFAIVNYIACEVLAKVVDMTDASAAKLKAELGVEKTISTIHVAAALHVAQSVLGSLVVRSAPGGAAEAHFAAHMLHHEMEKYECLLPGLVLQLENMKLKKEGK
jgi:hypothetical protein